MKATTLILVLGLYLVGCASVPPDASLSADQATVLALQLANAKASTLYHRQIFHDGQPASFKAGHWVWHQLTPGDYEATVELAANGTTNRVVVNLLNDTGLVP